VIAKKTGEPLDTTLTEKFNPLLLIDPNNQKHCDQMLLELVLYQPMQIGDFGVAPSLCIKARLIP